jgi:hypothetical protein
MIPAQPGQPARQWTITGDVLEMIDGKQVLRFGHAGLDISHAVVASVKLARPPFTRIGRAVFKGDVQDIRIELGALEANEPLELNLTVAQQDGALVFPVDYAFTAMATAGRADGSLKRLTGQAGPSPAASEPATETPADKAKRVKAEAAEEAKQRAEELANARASEKAQPKEAAAATSAVKAKAKGTAKGKAKSAKSSGTSKNRPRKKPSKKPRTP